MDFERGVVLPDSDAAPRPWHSTEFAESVSDYTPESLVNLGKKIQTLGSDTKDLIASFLQ